MRLITTAFFAVVARAVQAMTPLPGYPPAPTHNPMSAAKVELGR